MVVTGGGGGLQWWKETEVVLCAWITAAEQFPVGGYREASVVRKAVTKVIGKVRCVCHSMCRVMMIIRREENAAETKLSLWWPLAQLAHYHTNTRNTSRHGDSPTCLLTSAL